MAKKNFSDSLSKDIQQKTGLKTFYDAFKFVYSEPFRQQKAAEMGFVEVRPRVFEKPKTVNVIAPQKKYASIGKSQMRSGRSSTIQTGSTGLTSKATIKKKTLLGG